VQIFGSFDKNADNFAKNAELPHIKQGIPQITSVSTGILAKSFHQKGL